MANLKIFSKQRLTANIIKIAFVALILFVLNLLIFLPDAVYLFKNKVFNYLLIGFIISPLLLTIPTVLFFWNMRVYYYILALISAFTPIALLPVFLINSQPNTEMLGLILDTNYHEVTELMGWRLIPLILLCIVFFVVFVLISKKLPGTLSFKRAGMISLIAIALFLLTPFTRTTKTEYYTQILKNTFKTYHPFRVGDAIGYLNRELKNVENYKRDVANFSFGASRQLPDSSGIQKIHVLLIGETARYDRFSINGYERETSPLLAQQQNLLTFSNVSTSGTMTAIAVPLIISRADASNFDDHKKEKSILAAYTEAGYKSFWVSNQSKYGLTGNIGMHYNDGNATLFNGWGSNENNFSGNTDSALIPMIDSILRAETSDISMVVHMIGSHWRYILRYPEKFTKFKPVSDKNRMMMGYPPKEIMNNEYDNSILFTDYIIDQIINLVNSTGAEASITYVSDHGENLGDNKENPLYFHGYDPQPFTARIPLFIWTSDRFLKNYPEKFNILKSNKDRPISSGSNVFHTLLDLSGIRIKNHDSTRSIASPFYKDSEQIIRGSNGKLVKFKDLK